jgi:MFS family permease
MTSPQPRVPRPWRAIEAVSTLATWMSFAVVAWLLLVEGAPVARVGLVAGVQALAYLVAAPVGVQLVDRADAAQVAFLADLASAVALAAVAFFPSNVAVLAVLAGVVSAVRALADLATNLLSAAASRTTAPDQAQRPPAAPPREGLIRPLVLVAGAGLGAAAAWLGPVGALWVVATAFALCAALVVLATAPVPASRVVDAISAPTVELAAVPPAPAGPSGLRRWLFGWRLALILLLPAFAAQAAGVALVPVWTDGKPGTSGVLGGAFVVGAVAGAVLLRAPGVHPVRYLLMALGFLVGGGAIAVLRGLPPAGLLVVVAALLVGLATASVSPGLSTLLSQAVPPAQRSRVAASAATVVAVGIAAGSYAGGWLATRAPAHVAIGVAVAGYLVALLTPVLGYRTWQRLGGEEPGSLMGAAPKLSARLAITLAYTDGRWLVEVRKGRALLGTRHPVDATQALTTLSLLGVPGLRSEVEQALSTDKSEATRHAERMRAELTELETKLAGLSEMMDLTTEEKPD